MNTKENTNRACVLGYPVDLKNREEALEFAFEKIKQKQGIHVVTINPEIILAAENNQKLDKIIKKAELIIPDSTGMELSLKRQGFKAKKMAGIEFSATLIQKCAEKGFSVGFIGATEETIQAMQSELKNQYPNINICFARNGYFSEQDFPEIAEQLRHAQPSMLLVALGAPKQEYIIDELRKIIPQTLMIGVGGSFDVWAKKVNRAPVIFRMFGLEWFYRLLKQPSRFSRMFPALPLFIFRAAILNQKARKN